MGLPLGRCCSAMADLMPNSQPVGVAWLMRGQSGMNGPFVCVIAALGFSQTHRADVPRHCPVADHRLTADRIRGLISGHGIDVHFN